MQTSLHVFFNGMTITVTQQLGAKLTEEMDTFSLDLGGLKCCHSMGYAWKSFIQPTLAAALSHRQNKGANKILLDSKAPDQNPPVFCVRSGLSELTMLEMVAPDAIQVTDLKAVSTPNAA